MIPRDCRHGRLARSCDLCERDADIVALRSALVEAERALDVTADNLRHLGPNGGPVFAAYEVWLQVVEDALVRVRSAA
jgi:hypothetical protein